MVERTCSMVGVVGTFPCWHVDPAKAQGVSTWRLPAFGKSPITKPFYVFDRDGREQRHWLRADTGYAVGIRDKPVTANARTSLVWAEGEVLCDVTTGRGAPSPPPPPPLPPPLTACRSTSGVRGRRWWATSTATATPTSSSTPPVPHPTCSRRGRRRASPTSAPRSRARTGRRSATSTATAATTSTGTGGPRLRLDAWFGTGFGFLMTPIAADASLWPVIADIDGDGRD